MNGRDATALSESPIYEGKKVHQIKVAFIILVGWNCVEVDKIAVTWAITRFDFIPNLQNVLIRKRSEERNG